MQDFMSFLPTLQNQQKEPFRIRKMPTKSVQGLHLSTQNLDMPYKRYKEQKEEEEENAQMKKLLDVSKDDIPYDKQEKPTIGQEAIKRYHFHLKILDRVQEENHFRSQPESVYTAMHRTASDQTLLPCKIGLIKYTEPRECIKIKYLSSMKYGDKYLMMLQEGIKRSNHLEVFELRDNRITSNVSGTLMQSLSKNAKEVNLAKNRIGQIGVTNICKSLVSKDCRIEILDLEDNMLGNTLVIELCQSIKYNKTLSRLNLSKNFITNLACPALANMLSDTNIKEIYLYWNQIKSEGGILLFQGLLSNQDLKVMDLAYNSLGASVPSCAPSLAELFKTNVELRHVDLSFNYFGLKDTQVIAEGLCFNKTIYGFHFTGNRGYVDTKGFLIPLEQPENDQSQQQISQRIRSCKYQGQQRIRQFRDEVLRDCCWICEGWSQHEISWNYTEGGVDPTFVHLSYQDFSGLYFGKVDSETKGVKIQRMLPPGTTKYFFTIGDEQKLSPEHPSVGHSTILHNVKYAGLDQTIQMDGFNEFNVEINKNIFDSYYEPQITVLPRVKDPVYIPPKQKKNKLVWTFPISLFKPWVQNEEEIQAQCFETDWNGSRIPKIIKNEDDQEKTKAFMKSLYHHFRDTYKHYSSFNPVGDVWAIQSSIFVQILQATKLIITDAKDMASPPLQKVNTAQRFSIQDDDEYDKDRLQRTLKAQIKPQDLDLKFIGTLSGTEKGNPRKPDRGMIRFQFLEVWVRIAEQKYMQNGISTTICESMKYLWEDHLKQEFTLYSSQTWRAERYWNEGCDYCYKNYRSLIDHIYLTNAKKKVKPGQKPFMSLQELIDIVAQSGLTQYDHFASTVPFLAFNKAMMAKVDELTQDRIFQMSFVEFLEAFARIAEEASLPPFQGAFPETTEWNLQKQRELPLHYKIESLLMLCLDTVAEGSFKANYRKPDKSFFTPVPDSDDE